MNFRTLFEEGKDVVWFLEFLIEFLKLGGVALAMSALVNVGKEFGIVKDGKTQYWVCALQIAGVGVASYFGFTNPEMISEFLEVANEEGQKVALIVGFVIEIVVALKEGSFGYNKILKGLPVIGKSFSG